MKHLFSLIFITVLSCSNREQNYISIQQTASGYPIVLTLECDTIKYMDVPLAFLMNKTSSRKVILSSSTYLCASAYMIAPHTWDGTVFKSV